MDKVSDDQTAMEVAQGWLAAIINSAEDAIISKDLNGIITSWNPAAERLFGYTAPEALGRPITLIIPSDRLAEEPRILASIRRGESIEHYETIRRRKDGALLDISLTVSPILDQQGQIVGVSKIARDITDRKRAEEALHESEERFRSMADRLPLLVWMHDAQGAQQFANQTFCQFFGVTESEMRGGRWQMLIHQDDAEAYTNEFLACTRERRPFHAETRVRRWDGTWRWIESWGNPRFSSAGEYLGFIGTSTDITDRKEAEEALRKSEGEITDFIESAALGIHRVGPDGVIQWANRAELEMLGYEPHEYFGHHISEFHADQNVVEDIMQCLANGETIRDREAFMRAKDGSLHYVKIDSSGLWRDGEFKHSRCFTRDDTQRKQAEEDRERLLREVETERERLADIFQQAPSFMCIMRGPDHVFERANELYYEVVGHRELLGNPAREALPEIEGQGFIELLNRVYETGEPYVGSGVPIILRRHADGSLETCYVDFVYQALREPDGSISGVFAQGVDVTERKRAEEAVRNLNQDLQILVNQLQTVLEVSPVGIGVAEDPACRVIRVNPAFARIVGISPGINASKTALPEQPLPFKIFKNGRELRGEELPMQLAAATGTVVSGEELDLLREDGSVVHALMHVAPLFDEAGRPRGCVGALVDITEKKRAEDELTSVLDRLAAELTDMERLYSLSMHLLEQDELISVLEAVLKASMQLLGAGRGNIQLFDENRRVLEIAASIGFDQDFLDHFKTVVAADNTACADALETSQRVVVEDLSANPGFTEFAPMADRFGIRAVQSTPLRASNRKVMGVLSTHWSQPHRPTERELRLLDLYAQQATRHIERKRAEEALLEADRRKDQFLATLSHELRNPLASITSALHLLHMEQDDPALQQEIMGLLERQVGTLTRLVDDLLDVSRVTTGRIQLQQTEIALNALIQATADSFRPRMEARQHQFSVTLAGSPVWVKGDPTRLEQVVVNLLSNAVKFSPNGSRVWVTTEEERGDAIIRVGDLGMGIEPGSLPHIFELFTQGESGLDRSQGGLGIGLALVKSLVEMHGGTVTAASEGIGKGSEFLVRLPVAPPPQSKAIRGRESPGPGAFPLRVLVVEDDEDARRVLGSILNRLGHQVRTAHDGPSALTAGLELQPDVVLLDIGLPGMDGYEVAQRIRREPSLQNTVLVAVTGYGQQADRERSQQAGFDHHLVKPLDLNRLRELLEAIAGHGGV